MNEVRLQRIREAERDYHEQIFEHHKLYQPGSWLSKPVPVLLKLLERLDTGRPLQVLDLGCGVGRNSIPIARKIQAGGGRVVCVDLLDQALKKLRQYAREHGTDAAIVTEQADIGEYPIPANTYDYIIAASSLEHAKSPEALKKVLRRMAEGTKPGGINAVIMNTNIQEWDQTTGRRRETFIEVVMPDEKALDVFRMNYAGWEELHVSEEPLELNITREDEPVLLKADCVTFAVRKKT
ncbi:class I SAM-dependent methyltransferase [Paenibacillus sp. P26]|nr:class I SAM-dependent methyltransferase [Paenibacillus sp. P26]UUZ95632.1 class I SAM-dependent methyltransferase [Paenibacillus sp. P25]